ncbi:hypothetical protein U1Q18_015392 [Sarracenia purpurea var. burkii]
MGPHSLSFFPPSANTVGSHSQEGTVVSGGHGNLAIEDQSPHIKLSYATMIVYGIIGEKKQDGLCSHKMGNLGQEILVKGDALNLKDKEVGDGHNTFEFYFSFYCNEIIAYFMGFQNGREYNDERADSFRWIIVIPESKWEIVAAVFPKIVGLNSSPQFYHNLA